MLDEPRACLDFDPRIQLGTGAIVFAGQSNSGKTRLLLHLLNNIHLVNPKPGRVLVYYDLYQEAYGEMKKHLEEKEGVKVELRQGFDAERLTLENIEASQTPTLLCLDDFSDKCARSDEIARIATNGRHKNITLLIILHSLFYKYPASRIIMGNTAYFFLFPSVRMLSQVSILGSQLGMRERLVQAYKQATEVREEPYRYLLIDMTPCTPDLLRLRSDIHRQVQFCYAKTI